MSMPLLMIVPRTIFRTTSRLAMRCVLAALLFTTMAVAAPCLAAPALPGDILRDIESLKENLADANAPSEVGALEDRAQSQAQRLAGGNAADRWARALYLQLASEAAVQRQAYIDAAEYIAKARAVRGIDAAMRARWLHREANLRLGGGQQARGAGLLSEWLGEHRGEAADYWQLAGAQARLERWDEAKEAVSAGLARDDSPSDTRLMLAASIFQQAGADDQALGMLERLLSRAPENPDTWRRAAGLAQRLDQHAQAAALWEAGWRQGVLKGDDAFERRIRLHLAAGTPARAAELLKAALEQGRLDDSLARRRLLATAYQQARSRGPALAAWRHVAERSGKAEDWLYVGQLAAGWGKDAPAEEALLRAQSLGSEKAGEWLKYLDQNPLAAR